MAIGFERRQASLIGAGDLPFARITNAVPDVSSIGALGRDMQLSARQEKAQIEADKKAKEGISDRLKGQEAGAAYGQEYVGKDIYGYRSFEPPDGTPEFQLGYIDGFNQTQDGKFRQSMESRFNEIQANVIAGDLTPTDATKLMQSYVSGALETAPKHRRGAYYELGQQEIAQRSGLMTTQRASQDAQLVVDDLVSQTKTNIEKATSFAAAGGDPASFYAAIDKSYDTLVKMRRMGPKEAEAGKLAVRQNVTGQALANRLNTAMARGEISPDQIDVFGKAIASNNSDAEVVLQRAYQVGPNARIGEESYKSKDVITKITDENVRKDVAVKLTTMATEYRQAASAYADEKAFGAELALLNSPAGRGMSLSSAHRDNDDALMQKFLASAKPFDNIEDTKQLLGHLEQTKYVPKPLSNELFNMATSGDPVQTEKAVAIYRAIIGRTDGHGDNAGEALRLSMPNEVVEKLDAIDKAMALRFTPEDLAANVKKTRGNPEYAPGALIGQYNTKVKGDATGDGFWTDFRGKWAYDYGTMPDPQAKDAFTTAYTENMKILGDPEKAFSNAYELVKGRYRKNDIMLDGIEVGPGNLTNPAGYEVKTKGVLGLSRPGQEYDWLDWFLADEIVGTGTSNIVLPTKPNGEQMSQQEFDALQGGSVTPPVQPGIWDYIAKPSQAFNSNALGKTMKLQRVPGGDPDAPQFAIRLFDTEGHDLGPIMTSEGGGMHPLIVDPYAAKAREEEHYSAKKDLTGMETGSVERLGILDGKYMGKLSLDQSTQYDGTIPFGEYLDSVAPQLTKQYNLEKKAIEDGLEKARQTYEQQTGEKVPRTKIDQQTLLQPRAAGFDVAAAAAATVDSVLPDGSGGTFLLRLAAQESNFGMASGTYRLSGDKGMTQVNTSSGFKEVKRRIAQGSGRVYEAAQVLNQRLGLDLNNLSKDDLDRPIVAMAVARLYVEAVGRSVPADLEGQALWWKKHYNTVLGAGTASQFVRSASKVPEDWRNKILMEG